MTLSAAHAQLVVIVSAKSQVNALTRQQVSKIFLGRTHAYPDGSRAVPVDLQNGTGLREEFVKRSTASPRRNSTPTDLA